MPTTDPQPVAPIRQALARLLRAARGFAFLYRRPTHALADPAAPTQTEPKPHPGHTIARTTAWLAALARTLAGDRFFHRPVTYRFPAWPHRFPPFTAKLREECGLPPIPPRTEAQEAAAHLWYVRKVFATQATGVIAARLARRLGLTQKDAAWPHALIAIATPPAQTPAARIPGRRPRPTRGSPFPPLPPMPRFTTQTAPRLRRVPLLR